MHALIHVCMYVLVTWSANKIDKYNIYISILQTKTTRWKTKVSALVRIKAL